MVIEIDCFSGLSTVWSCDWKVVSTPQRWSQKKKKKVSFTYFLAVC